MNTCAIILDVARAGGQVHADRGDLVITAPVPLPHSLITTIKRHKAELVAVLSHSAVELPSLVYRVTRFYGCTPDEQNLALEIALADPDAAIECFRTLVAPCAGKA